MRLPRSHTLAEATGNCPSLQHSRKEPLTNLIADAAHEPGVTTPDGAQRRVLSAMATT